MVGSRYCKRLCRRPAWTLQRARMAVLRPFPLFPSLPMQVPQHLTSDATHCARTEALAVLSERAPAAKAAAAQALYARVLERSAAVSPQRALAEPPGLPGRPARPELVEPRKLGRRSMQSPQGRAVLLHALAHIEFNAINLALDAVWRFGGMPEAFYIDWLKVACEESLHFSLLEAHLRTLGHAYGRSEERRVGKECRSRWSPNP